MNDILIYNHNNDDGKPSLFILFFYFDGTTKQILGVLHAAPEIIELFKYEALIILRLIYFSYLLSIFVILKIVNYYLMMT